MNNNFTVGPKRKRVVAGVLIGMAVVVSLTGAYAYKTVFARPGEGALRYVPADSMVVVSIDLTPSPAQALAFKHIDDSLSRNGMDRVLESSILDVLDHGVVSEALRPLVLRSGAAYLTPKAGKQNDFTGALFVAVTDGAQATQILQKKSVPQFYKGLKYFKSSKDRMMVMVVDDLLVLSDSPVEFYKIKQIHDGEAKPITFSPAYLAARDKIASDANLMVYMAPDAARNILKSNGMEPGPLPDWIAVGLAIRDGGVGVSCTSKMDVNKAGTLPEVARSAPVRADLFEVLPAGSYGMMAISNPTSYFDTYMDQVKNNKDLKKGMAEAEDSVQKGIGLSVKQDLLPAFKGDAVAAVYPTEEGRPAGFDLLLVVDDSNGGDPAEAVNRFQSFVDTQMAKEGNSPKLFDVKDIPGGREYRINDKTEHDMRDSMGKSVGNSYDKGLLVGNKTIAYAIVGKAVIAASSQALLDRAVASYESKTNGMTGDAAFAPQEAKLLDGSQSLAAFSVSRIATGIRNSFPPSKMSPDSQKTFNSIFDALESLKEPLTMYGKITQDGEGSGGVFIPMDYDKLIDLIGSNKPKH